MIGKLIDAASEATLKELIAWWRRRRNDRGTPDVIEDLESHMAPEMYIARVPDSGIPGRSRSRPGVARDVQIYELTEYEELSPVTDTRVDVFNASTEDVVATDVEDGVYVQVIRDKYGRWWVDTGKGGIDVCGSPQDPQAQNDTDVGCMQPECDELSMPNISHVRLQKCIFVVRREEPHCSNDELTTGTGTGTDAVGEHGVYITLGGMNIDVEYVRHTEFCVGSCDVFNFHGVLCIRSGLIMDHYFILDEEGCSSGTAEGTSPPPSPPPPSMPPPI